MRQSGMRVRVRLFGALREQAGAAEWWRELPSDGSVGDLLAILRAEGTLPEVLLKSSAVAVNQEYAGAAHTLRDGDEVALLPPVSGGSGQQIALVYTPIDTAALSDALKQPGDGAVCVFDGVVRDNTGGRGTVHLDYEAYEEMALQQMRRLAAQAVARFGVRDVTLVHRLGRLTVGETSVLIAVASAHRAAAFDACRWLIDTLKAEVPIWKREQFVDGAVWAAGEPLPPVAGAGDAR